MIQSFRVTAKALIYLDDQILLIRKPDWVWDLPGGRLDPGEHPERALRREIREELGIPADICDLVDCALRRTKNMDVFVLSYHCLIEAALRDIRLSEEHIEARLFHVPKVADLTMHDTYKDAARRGFTKLRGNKADLHPAAAEALDRLQKSQVFAAS